MPPCLAVDVCVTAERHRWVPRLTVVAHSQGCLHCPGQGASVRMWSVGRS